MYQTETSPRRGGPGANEAEKASGDGDEFSLLTLPITIHDPYCGPCNGPAGPEGAWCDDCITECKAHTLRLDLGAEVTP